MTLSTAQLDVTIQALREFIQLYQLDGYDEYIDEVQDAKEALAALLLIRGQ